MRRFLLTCGVSLLSGVLFLLPHDTSFAEMTEYRSAGTITTSGKPEFTGLSNCSDTDGFTCDRVPASSSNGHLYFNDFGDFGIPEGSLITFVRVRVIGKSTAPMYIHAQRGRGENRSSQCQHPAWLWQMWELQGEELKTFNTRTTLENGSLNYCLSIDNIRANNFTFTIRFSGSQLWTAHIDNLEIAFEYEPPIEPTPSPPEPFLDLPFDYEGAGYDFKQVIYNPGSWFDHEYPLQNVECCVEVVLPYSGIERTEFYRSHSGYDYASGNGVFLNTPVLAAASGWATFGPESDTAGAGNTIKIDHENGYQTWYEHLAPEGLIISTSGERVFVEKGDVIGKVGMTGNTTGPHIHMSVFKDANENGTFNDDYPWGLTDPLGWEGDFPDPWTQWESGGKNGTTSYNLFIDNPSPTNQTIPTTGGILDLDDIILHFTQNTFSQSATITADYGPFETASDTIESIMPSVFLEAFDNLGQEITQFLQPVTITYDYTDVDLSNIHEDTLMIYWFNEDSGLWKALPSSIDAESKTVSAQTTHFSQFALMGELKDIIPPTTEIIATGDKGPGDWYQSDIRVELIGQDNEGGIGLQYTLYTRNGSDWYEYSEPIIFTEEKTHTITYQSFDKVGNKGDQETTSFRIDKTPPEAAIQFDPEELDILVTGTDSSGSATVRKERQRWGRYRYVVEDEAENTTMLDTSSLNLGIFQKMYFNDFTYSNGTEIDFDRNALSIFYLRNRERELSYLLQTYYQKGEEEVILSYTKSRGTTRILIKEKDEERVLEEVEGLRLLQLYTEDGTLLYRY